MIERGCIETIGEETVTVRQERGIACFGCMNQECKNTRGLIIARNATGRELRAGQLVETDIPGASILIETLGALLPPFLGFAAAYLVSGLLGLPESARAALGALGLFAAAGLLYLYRRSFPARTGPEIIRVLDAARTEFTD
ncbi:MAG: SoxR reducing system RseC family protein [Spirochaetaceae bacterium]|jgi:sigma-E factor negative regulatory protein RseC|nr:SoxR reducing system RseC family protein [Spirochaetaceae bacterium]